MDAATDELESPTAPSPLVESLDLLGQSLYLRSRNASAVPGESVAAACERLLADAAQRHAANELRDDKRGATFAVADAVKAAIEDLNEANRTVRKAWKEGGVRDRDKAERLETAAFYRAVLSTVAAADRCRQQLASLDAQASTPHSETGESLAPELQAGKKAPAFQLGDVVTLASGGPRMTVLGRVGENGFSCGWFRDGVPRSERFSARVIRMAPAVDAGGSPPPPGPGERS